MPLPSDKPTNPGADSFLSSVEKAAQNTSPEQNDDFWDHAEIDGGRWNRIYPYQLILVKRDANGKYSQVDQTGSKNKATNWVFTLPFPPEAINISMPFAIEGSVTQGGYYEEHGGAPVRAITFAGSLGVVPLRPSADTRKEDNLAQAIFAGTIQASKNVGIAYSNAQADLTGNNPSFTPNLLPDSTFSDPGPDNVGVTTGYYQMRLLQNFFENYVSFKQTREGAPYRLALCIWKQQAVYLVTPQVFNLSFNANSPLEPTYNLVFRAWRRITLQSASDKAANAFRPAARSANKLKGMLTAISDARDVLENARDVISAVGGDLDVALFEPLRQVGMFLRDAINVPLSFADLPVQILNDSQTAIVQYLSVKQAGQAAGDVVKQQAQRIVDAYNKLAGAAYFASNVSTRGTHAATVNTTDEAFDVFRNPDDYYDLLKNLGPSSVHLSPQALRAIQAERVKIRQLKRADFESMRDTIVQLQADFADAVGAGSTTYNKTYNRAVRATSKQPTLSDFMVMFALNRVVLEINRLAASGETDNRLKTVDFLAGAARRSGIAFTVPNSKFAVPFPFGVTLEQLSQRYLGDPDRWIEVAALNGLRAPYVDEVGFDLPLLVNGNGNQVQVADVSELFIGQQVWVRAAGTTTSSRHITAIEELSAGNYLLTLDGAADLDRYNVLAGASLHAFLPDTVNSMQMIYIPSDLAPSIDDTQTKPVPGLDQFDELLNVGGFDLLLTQDNDIAITPDGDQRLAVGLANIIQTARIRLSVVQGTLNRHPSFGLPVQVGQSTADLDAQSLLQATKNLFSDDPTFTGVTSATVMKQGPVTTIGLSIGVYGQSQVIPITLNLTT